LNSQIIDTCPVKLLQNLLLRVLDVFIDQCGLRWIFVEEVNLLLVSWIDFSMICLCMISGINLVVPQSFRVLVDTNLA
jgi:hypothetical protein